MADKHDRAYRLSLAGPASAVCTCMKSRPSCRRREGEVRCGQERGWVSQSHPLWNCHGATDKCSAHLCGCLLSASSGSAGVPCWQDELRFAGHTGARLQGGREYERVCPGMFTEQIVLPGMSGRRYTDQFLPRGQRAGQNRLVL